MRVAFVALDPADPEPAAWHWLRTRAAPADGVLESARITADQLSACTSLDRPAGGDPANVVWLHATAPPAVSAALAVCPALRDLFVADAAAGVLLTGAAVLLPALTGMEAVAPNDIVDRTWRDDEDELFLFRDFAETPRIRGHAAFRRHSLFQGLGSGVYTWWPHDGDAWRAFTCRLPAWPAAAHVIAVERAFIHISPDRATIWAYERPRVLCIGAYFPFESADPIFRPHLEHLARNALHWAARPTTRTLITTRDALIDAGRDQHWSPPQPTTARDASIVLPALRPVPQAAAAGGPAGTEDRLDFDPATLRMAGRAERPFTLAGRRAFAAGEEADGVAEIWVHPLRVVKDARLGVAAAQSRPSLDPDSAGEGACPARPATSVVVTSLGIERSITLAHDDDAAVALTERLHVVHDQPVVLLQWALDDLPSAPSGATATPQAFDRGGSASARVVRLRFEWTADLRLMWPYPAGALGPLHWHAAGPVLAVRAARSGETAYFVADGAGVVKFDVANATADAAPQLRCALSATLEPGRVLTLRILAATGEADEPQAILEAVRPANRCVRSRAAGLHRLQQERLRIDSPDARVNGAVEWAKLRLDTFLADTPGVGRSLVAGYWRSRPGWNDGRPGYAWYFGRDAVWTAFAALATGDFHAARDVLAFLAAKQDLNGKIPHECTTSGSVHYDAADATPLFLLLAARYLAWSGDTDAVAGLWPALRRALDFCIATDTDGDGLIENPRVGHGWIEFGRLGGGRATFYNAGIWAAALRGLVAVAEALGDVALAADLRHRHRRARAAVAERFLDPGHDGYALRIEPADFTPTATHAVPLLLDEADADRSRSWLDLVASDAFTTPWGVRMVAASDPGFRPDSYHGGAVWPLYTGWASWAEFLAGRPDSAYRHWRQVIDNAFTGARGAWDEVLHGTEPRAIGVCPDQAWSAAMAIAPLVHGLLGLDPDATRGRVGIRTVIPKEWDRLDVHNIRVGDARLDLRYRRHGHRHVFRIEQTAGAVPFRLVFEPAIPGRLRAAAVDGQPAALVVRPSGDRSIAPVQLALDHERCLELDAES